MYVTLQFYFNLCNRVFMAAIPEEQNNYRMILLWEINFMFYAKEMLQEIQTIF